MQTELERAQREMRRQAKLTLDRARRTIHALGWCHDADVCGCR